MHTQTALLYVFPRKSTISTAMAVTEAGIVLIIIIMLSSKHLAQLEHVKALNISTFLRADKNGK